MKPCAAAVCVVGVFAVAVFGQSPREIAKQVSPAVVLLVMEDANGQPLSMGSGFVVREGVVATNSM
jgi:S1-C subfamily serine protease